MSSISGNAVYQAAKSRRIDFSPYLVGVGLGVLSWIAFAIAERIPWASQRRFRASGSRSPPPSSATAPPQATPIGRRCRSPGTTACFFSSVFPWARLSPRWLQEHFASKSCRDSGASASAPRSSNALPGRSSAARRSCTAPGWRAAARAGTACRGGMQLAVSSWVFLVVMFASALIASALMLGGLKQGSAPMIEGSVGLGLAMGFVFGWLLDRGRVTDCNVIEGQFRLSDFTMLKVMLPAIVVGGLGVVLSRRGGRGQILHQGRQSPGGGAGRRRVWRRIGDLGLLSRNGARVGGNGQRPWNSSASSAWCSAQSSMR